MELFYLKQRMKKLNPNYPFSANPNIVLFLLIAMGLLYVLILAFFLWCFMHVRAHVQGYKPVFKLLKSYFPVEPSTDHDKFHMFTEAYQATCPNCICPGSDV